MLELSMEGTLLGLKAAMETMTLSVDGSSTRGGGGGGRDGSCLRRSRSGESFGLDDEDDYDMVEYADVEPDDPSVAPLRSKPMIDVLADADALMSIISDDVLSEYEAEYHAELKRCNGCASMTYTHLPDLVPKHRRVSEPVVGGPADGRALEEEGYGRNGRAEVEEEEEAGWLGSGSGQDRGEEEEEEEGDGVSTLLPVLRNNLQAMDVKFLNGKVGQLTGKAAGKVSDTADKVADKLLDLQGAADRKLAAAGLKLSDLGSDLHEAAGSKLQEVTDLTRYCVLFALNCLPSTVCPQIFALN